MSDEAINLARVVVCFDGGNGDDERIEVKLARAVLSQHDENTRLRAALADALEDSSVQLAALEGYQCWNPDALQRRRERIAELRKEWKIG